MTYAAPGAPPAASVEPPLVTDNPVTGTHAGNVPAYFADPADTFVAEHKW